MTATQPEPHPQGHLFTKNEAAEACGVDVSTIKRRLAKGEFPHAFQDSKGIWRIPLADLTAAGLNVNAPAEPVHEQGTPAGRELPGNAHPDPGAPGMPLTLDEYRELIEARVERDQLREMLRRADQAAEDARQNAWQWYEQAQLVQRQLMPGEGETTIDLTNQRRGIFRRKTTVRPSADTAATPTLH